MAKLSKDERLVFEWLSREDASALGECKGAALDRLVDLGIAEIGPAVAGRHDDYRWVCLSEYGWEKIADQRSDQRDAENLSEMDNA